MEIKCFYFTTFWKLTHSLKLSTYYKKTLQLKWRTAKIFIKLTKATIFKFDFSAVWQLDLYS